MCEFNKKNVLIRPFTTLTVTVSELGVHQLAATARAHFEIPKIKIKGGGMNFICASCDFKRNNQV